jgi:hypothetical protein
VCEVYICLNNTLALGDIKASSSRGPTEDGRQKPDIAAPGTMIISSITHDAPICSGDQQDNCLDPMMITPDGNNYVESGTSMSAPHVAGVIALMLQVNPRLDPNTVDSILRRTARHDQFTGSANWTPSFGAGKIDALAAVQAVLGGSQAPQPTPTKPVTLPTPIPATSLSFHILAARPQKSGSKPNLSGSVLTHGQIGKKMSLYIYLEIQSIPDNSRVLLEWTVKKNGTTLGYNSNQKTFNHADTGDFWARYSWTPRRSGTYTFVGRVTINGQSSEGSSVFTVGRK